MSKPTVNVADLDFDVIKENLKTFLRNDGSYVSDFDYEGSAANVLLDILAANTHYNAFYANMVANEMFADSAVLRSSVVSHAKTRGYTPRSARASKATISMDVSPVTIGISSIVVSKGTTFTTTVDDIVQTYSVLDDIYLESNGQGYSGSLEIFSGNIYQEQFVYSEGMRIFLKNKNIDTSFLKVSVQKSEGNLETQIFSNGVRYTSLSYNTNAFFVHETDLGFYELRFGDGKLGTKLFPGNIVKVEYLIANVNAVKGAKTFSLSSDFYPEKTKTITTINRSSGFIIPESIQEIKQSISRIDGSQYRSVVSEDFALNLKLDDTDVVDVAVWGGEENIPPVYGKVFVSPIIRDLSFIPESKKLDIASKIKKRSVISVRPIVVEPEIVYIIVSGIVRFSGNFDILPSTIKANVSQALEEYNDSYLKRFYGMMNPSLLSEMIKAKHESIFSPVLSFEMYSVIDIDVDKVNVYDVKFRNPIKRQSIYSDSFSVTGEADKTFVLRDDGLENINLYFTSEQSSIETFYSKVGSIDYSNGIINMNNFSGISSEGTTIRIVGVPEFQEFVANQNSLLIIDVPESINHIEAKRT